MLLIAVGKLRAGPEQLLVERYRARLRPGLEVREVNEGAGTGAEAKRREGAAILAALPSAAFVVALDPGGRALDSEGLAAAMRGWQEQGRAPAFIIGGAEGLSEAVLARAGFRLSLGAMTWPHMLARVMLAEQLYRAQSILAGHPYHRG